MDQKWRGERRGVELGCRRDRKGEDVEEQKKGCFGIRRRKHDRKRGLNCRH